MSYKPSKQLEEKLSKAKALLVLDHPFYASTLMKKDIRWAPELNPPTMAVDARGNIYLHPEFVDGLSVNNLIWGLAHECMHYMLLHPARKGTRKHRPWNWACDGVINDMLDHCGPNGGAIGERIPDTVDVPNARNMKAEDLYQDMQDKGGSGGQGGEPHIGGMGEDLIEGDLSDSDLAEIEAQVKVDVAQARNVAKMQDKMPGALERMVDDIIHVPTPWYTILERFMTSMGKLDVSWSRPNRKHLHAGNYLPGYSKTPTMGEVVVAVDTSGSIGGPELAEFAGHLNAILDQCVPKKVHVLYCDARVGSSEEFTPDELPVNFTKVSGGGGTDFTPVFDYVEANNIEPDVLVYLTDGYGGCRSNPPAFPTVWLTTGTDKFPFGEVVKFERVQPRCV